MLQVAPEVPQPVVKVPTPLLAHGLPSLWGMTAREPHSWQAAAPQLTQEPVKADMYACGVLLLKLLGVDLDHHQDWEQQLQQQLQRSSRHLP